MGAGKETRDIRAMARYFDDQRRERRNTNEAKALWWRDLMQEGHVLTFRNSGRVFTAGPYRTAVPGHARFALLWSGPAPRRARDWFAGQAWDVALRIVEYVGRLRPAMIDGEKT